MLTDTRPTIITTATVLAAMLALAMLADTRPSKLLAIILLLAVQTNTTLLMMRLLLAVLADTRTSSLLAIVLLLALLT